MALLLTLAPALMLAALQAAPAPAGQQAIQTAGQAFGQCLSAKVASAPVEGTPEAAADVVWAMCGTQWAALETAVDAMVSIAPPEKQAMAREQMRSGIAQGKAGLADGIRQMRAAHATAPAPAPTPTPPAGH